MNLSNKENLEILENVFSPSGTDRSPSVTNTTRFDAIAKVVRRITDSTPGPNTTRVSGIKTRTGSDLRKLIKSRLESSMNLLWLTANPTAYAESTPSRRPENDKARVTVSDSRKENEAEISAASTKTVKKPGKVSVLAISLAVSQRMKTTPKDSNDLKTTFPMNQLMITGSRRVSSIVPELVKILPILTRYSSSISSVQ